MKKLLLILAPLSICFLSGCVNNASRVSMSAMLLRSFPTTPIRSKILEKNIVIAGLPEKHEGATPKIPGIAQESFKSALIYSLTATGLYGENSTSRYRLNARLIKLEQPHAGIDMTVTCVARYDLIENNTKKSIYNKVIRSQYSATFGDDFLGSNRARDANEGAIRTNIEKFIANLYALKLSSKLKP